jgi:uncharacterized protein YjbI with pentapeptide repeats
VISDPRDPIPPRIPETLLDSVSPVDDLVDEAEPTSTAFTGADLSGRKISGMVVRRSRFATCRLGTGRFERVSLADCDLVDCDLANLWARKSSLVRVSITGSRATGLSWVDGGLKEVRWENCRVDLASFRFARFASVLFVGCDLRQADFEDADLRGARFVDCDLSGAQFSNATMTGTRFSGCSLLDVAGVHSMRGAVVDLRDVTDLAFGLAGALGIVIDE